MMASMICVVMVVKMIIIEMMVMSLLLPSGDLGIRYPLVDVLSLFSHFQMFSGYSKVFRDVPQTFSDVLRMFSEYS